MIFGIFIGGISTQPKGKVILIVTKTAPHTYNVSCGSTHYVELDEEELDCFVMTVLDPLANY